MTVLNNHDFAAGRSIPAGRSFRGQPLSRREFLGQSSWNMGGLALASMLSGEASAAGRTVSSHFPGRAKRIIFLYQSGGPSQIDLFDWKPQLRRRHGQQLPDSIRMGQRLTTMTADQKSLPLTASPFRFAKHGNCRTEVSELLPHTATVVDELCVIRSLYTEAINHDPAITFMQTGSQQLGRPSMGAWVDYALGNENENLPAFVVMISGGAPGDQPLYGRLWGAGFLPSQHQGVKFRGGKEPVLYLSNPAGIDHKMRQDLLRGISQLNERRFQRTADPNVLARTRQFEIAGRMQTSVPRLADLSSEPKHVLSMYGQAATTPGSFAANCLLARRLAERGVRFVQLYHRGWDHHKDIEARLRVKCREVDQPAAALIKDLKQRGLLEDTLVIWAGEFGRTAFCQGQIDQATYGRDHHPRCFTIWMAGGGIKAGANIGRTDEFSYNAVELPIHVHDLQATVLHCLGFDHKRLTYRHEGRDHRLTDIGGRVVNELLA